MTFSASVTPDITEGLPALLSARTVSSEGEARGVLYDVIISGVGFTFAIDSQNPYLRETVAVQKQQIDTSPEAGEQTLEGNWVRSQTSWHLGAGADYYEPGSKDGETPTRYRFKDSRGVDVWTKGQLSLHPAMVQSQSTAGTAAVCGGRTAGGSDVWFSRIGNEVFRHVAGVISSNGTPGGGFSLAGGRLAAAGKVVLVGSNIGVWSTPLAGSALTLISSQGAPGPVCQPWWVKSRIIITKNNEIHQRPLSGGVIDATSLVYAHPDSDWVWTGVTETPDAILAAGRSGGTGAIYAFVLAEDSGGSIPKLGQPFVVAELPPGEEVTALQSYLGKYLGIGTTAGIRVGLIGTNGQVQYGPLLVQTAAPVTALAARDSFLYAGAGRSVIRVGLEASVDDGLRFPYAYDVELPEGTTIGSLAFDGVSDTVVAAADGSGSWAAGEDRVATGWLQSGDIRYGTIIPKAFRTLDLMASTGAASSVAVSVIIDGVTNNLITLSDGKSGQGIGISGSNGNVVQLGYKLTLGAAAASPSPVVEAVSVKAVPAPHRQRLVQFPLAVADWMRDSKNVAFGRDGYATTLLATLEALEQDRAVVSVTDRTRPETFEATVEKVEFARVEPRARNGKPNFGGVAKITLRTL